MKEKVINEEAREVMNYWFLVCKKAREFAFKDNCAGCKIKKMCKKVEEFFIWSE